MRSEQATLTTLRRANERMVVEEAMFLDTEDVWRHEKWNEM